MSYSSTASDLKGVSAIFPPQKCFYMKFLKKKNNLAPYHIILHLTVEFPPKITLHLSVSLT